MSLNQKSYSAEFVVLHRGKRYVLRVGTIGHNKTHLPYTAATPLPPEFLPPAIFSIFCQTLLCHPRYKRLFCHPSPNTPLPSLIKTLLPPIKDTLLPPILIKHSFATHDTKHSFATHDKHSFATHI